MSLRKSVEQRIRSIRSYFLPSHLASAKRARALARPLPSNQALCVFDFTSLRIDNVTGRYLYHLVTEFESLGYAIAYTDRFRFLATMEAKACKKLLLEHPFSLVPADAIPPECKVIVSDRPDSHQQHPAQSITVVYDHERPAADDDTAFCLPFFVHPEIHESGQVEGFLKQGDLKASRPMRLLFAGNAKAPKYDAPVLTDKYHVLSRVKALAVAEQALGPDRVRRPLELSALIPPTELRETLTIATTQDLRIPAERWIETLALADFYFACPGVEMPLCHNLIESLAAGAIPILQYPQYLDPPLEHLQHCLCYHDEDSLVEALELALSMPESQVTELKVNAQAYYREHQQPGNFARRLIDSGKPSVRLYLNAYRVPKPQQLS